uniref:Uncharacterized protein n=1 Tax=Oryza sativa subsp. japonica TaxID=39947 RepID=Q75KC8_ORYSJ|nr:hypothetical protein [Oryza sativa Japonica Group]
MALHMGTRKGRKCIEGHAVRGNFSTCRLQPRPLRGTTRWLLAPQIRAALADEEEVAELRRTLAVPALSSRRRLSAAQSRRLCPSPALRHPDPAEAPLSHPAPFGSGNGDGDGDDDSDCDGEGYDDDELRRQLGF